jgi:hypothetical protein
MSFTINQRYHLGHEEKAKKKTVESHRVKRETGCCTGSIYRYSSAHAHVIYDITNYIYIIKTNSNCNRFTHLQLIRFFFLIVDLQIGFDAIFLGYCSGCRIVQKLKKKYIYIYRYLIIFGLIEINGRLLYL